jgi:hypothetical protein
MDVVTVTLPDGNWVRLAPRLSVPMGAAVMAAIRNAESTESEVEAAIAAAFLRHGIVEWSFKNGEGQPAPISNATINEHLDWVTAHEVAEKCNDLYAADLFRPLLQRMAKSSPTGLKDVSTLVPTVSGLTLPQPSKPSSRHATGAGKRSGARAR